MKFAAISMKGKIGDVENNMIFIRSRIEKAVQKKAEFIVLPEFFNTGFALHPNMREAIKKAINTTEIIKSWSRELNVIISGSYLRYNEQDKQVYNSFIIVFPDGTVYEHCKDIPTAIEAIYYTYGDSNRVYHTPVGRIGVVMCWEQIRYKTIREMIGKVDYVIAGSCWWNFCKEDGLSFYNDFATINAQLANQAPITLAHILGVPVIHASHMCSYEGVSIGKEKLPCVRKIEGKTLIADSFGNIIKDYKQSEDEILLADVEKETITKPCKIPTIRYWIPKMPVKLKLAFWYSNYVCHRAYKNVH